ncbi:hypothetical protein ScPMuIL_000972 [Solemya velum]
MASKKKRTDPDGMEMPPADAELSNEDDSGSDNSDMEVNEQVQVEFEARNPEDSDFGGIKTLLHQLFLKSNVDISELTDTLISQNYIGSVIKQCDIPEDDDDDDDMEDDDTIFGVISVVNLTERKDLKCVKSLKCQLLERCKQCSVDQVEKLNKLLDNEDSHVGFLISERFINIPPQIAVPMFDSLVKEMEKARRKNMKYDFKYYLMICKTYKLRPGKKNKAEEMFYSNSEEEFFKEISEMSFSYCVSDEHDTVVEGKWGEEGEMDSYRTVLVIPADKLDTALVKIKSALA